MTHFTLAAFGAERRIATIMIFRGTQMEGNHPRHLPLDTSKALGSVREHVARTLEEHCPEFIAISRPSSKAGTRVQSFCTLVKEMADEAGIPALEVDAVALMVAFGHPPLTRKEQVRRVGRAIWPELGGSKSQKAAVDAATTGLYVQIERLFSLHEVEP